MDTSITLWVVPLERLARVSLERSEHIVITIIIIFIISSSPPSSSLVGWTFQGGLAGNTGGRFFGFGVDQVRARVCYSKRSHFWITTSCESSLILCSTICYIFFLAHSLQVLQVEMVLPNGHHVKFGPTEWENVDGNVVPKTTVVSGLCHTNPEETDEELWTWEACPEDANINFGDLWFAVRGGGGGTWGVILSMHLQLHEYLPYERVTLFKDTCLTQVPSESESQAMAYVYTKFLMYLLLDPQTLNMTDDDANACGWPPEDSAISCYGEGSGQVVAEYWKGYISAINETLISQDIPPTLIEAVYNCPSVEYFKDLGDFYSAAFSSAYPEGYPYAENFPDLPYPGLRVTLDDTVNVIVPKEWVLSDMDTAMTYLGLSSAQYAAFGGRNMESTSDLSNALSQAHRDGAYMYFVPISAMTDDFYSQLFPLMYDTSNKTNFPGFIGSNHAGINTMGPLKDDWTKACPLDWTVEERDEKCKFIVTISVK